MTSRLSPRLQFVRHSTSSTRRHFVCEDDVRTVLSRLPANLVARLKKIHFKDDARGNRVLGYTTVRGRREISLCALPHRVSLSGVAGCENARTFGALPGSQWPTLAIRRFLLYDTLLHEVGHLQEVHSRAKNPRRKFAGETRAEDFADDWRAELWAKPLDHPDPAHHAPTREELRILERGWIEAHLEYRRGLDLKRSKDFVAASKHFSHAVELYPWHTLALVGLGEIVYEAARQGEGEGFERAESLACRAIEVDPLLWEAHLLLAFCLSRLDRRADCEAAFRTAIQLDPSGCVLLVNYAGTLSRWGRDGEAKKLLENSLERNPEDPFTISIYANLLLKEWGSPPLPLDHKAIALLRRAVKADPEDSLCRMILEHALSRVEAGAMEAGVTEAKPSSAELG